MSSECVCHTNKWCFYCEMYVPLERTLADRDAEIQRLKELISGNKGIEELYTAQQNLFKANFEIKILKNLVKSIDNEKDAEIKRLGSVLTKICHYPPAETTANVARYYEEMRAAANAALSHQTEQPDTPSGPSKSSMGLLPIKDCEHCNGEGEVCWEDGDELKGGPCHCQPADGRAIKTCINGCEENALEHSSFCYDCYVRLRMY